VVTWERHRVGQEQGGTDKSTLCAALGVAAEEIGERVFMVDLDLRGSLSALGERRKAEMPKFMGGNRMPQKGKTDGLLEASRRRLTGSASIPLLVTAEAIDDQCDTLDDDEIIVVTAPEWMLCKPRPKRKFRPS
jgi:cellulose biosynthesis protein BcsQ